MSIPRTDASILRGVNVLAVVEWTAFFSAYIVMGVYLVEVAGFDDVGAGWAAGAFGLGLCLLGVGYLYQRFVFPAVARSVASAGPQSRK